MTDHRTTTAGAYWPRPTTATFASLAALAAERFGDAPALRIVGGSDITFTCFEDEVARHAAGLARQGLGPGDRIVLHMPNSIEWAVASHAVARIGATLIPANILLTAEEVAFIGQDAQATGLIATASALAVIAAQGFVASHPITVGEPGSSTEATSFAALRAETRHEGVACSRDDLWTIGYTSGTTGRPKGAMLSHGAVFDSIAGTATFHQRHSADIVLTALPFSHVYGNIVLNCAFLAGTAILAMPRFDAGQALQLIAEHRVTLFEGVPTMYFQMLAHEDIEQLDASSLTRCTVGGQTIPPAKIAEIERRFGCPMLELWGMTEVAGPAITHSPFWPGKSGSIGFPFPGIQARIAGPDGAMAPDGEAGELQVRGSQVMTGYWQNDAAPAEAIVDDGWLRTGDVAIRDGDGSFRIVDRLKDMIISGGYNIYPAELEAAIARHPAVAVVAVVGVPDETKGETPKAFVVLHAGASCTAQDIADHCRKHLAPYKTPRHIEFCADLPRNSTGKILRRALKAPA